MFCPGVGKLAVGGEAALAAFFIGIAVISIGLSVRFAHKHKE